MRTVIGTVLIAVVLLTCTGCPPAPVASSRAPSATAAAAQPIDPLEKRIEAAINQVRGRTLEQSHGFWTIFHGILGLGPDVKMIDPKTGKLVKALDYIRNGGEMPGLRFDVVPQGLDVFIATDQNRFFAQGHQD